jgi:hypothetical protein
MQEGRVPVVRAERILRQVAAALTRAHALGIVHRDLKPENVVIADRESERDVVKVIDFGIARVTGSALGANGPALTQLGAVFGTPEYMAPEQAMGQPVDARADQYSLGVMAFELLTGQRPFTADDAIDLLRMHVGAPVPPATSIASDLPPDVDGTLARLLAKKPEDRFESVQVAISALDAALGRTSMPSAAGRLPRDGPLLVADPQRRKAAAIGLVGFVALAIVLAAATRPRSHPSPPPPVGVVDSRPIATRMAAYQVQPDVADALGRSLRGDLDGAVAAFRNRLARDPHDALASYFLGTIYRNARRGRESADAFATAVRTDPALAEDSTLARSLVEALGDPQTASTVEPMLRTPPLSQSVAVAQAVVDEAIDGSSPSLHNAALGLAEPFSALLTPLDQARVRLRLASNCDELRAALGALESIGGAGGTEATTVRQGACDMLRMGDRCRDCFEHRGTPHGH